MWDGRRYWITSDFAAGSWQSEDGMLWSAEHLERGTVFRMGEVAMKVEDWGYTNPVVSYLYGKPPLIWRDMVQPPK